MALAFGHYIPIAALLLLTFSIARILFNGFRNPLNRVPGPYYARFTNLPLKVAVMAGRRIHFVHTLHQRYGPYVRIAPKEIAVNSLQSFKQIHGINSGFLKSTWYQDLVFMDRPGIFSMIDAKQHAGRRKLFARPFSKTHLREHWESAVRERIELAVSRMREVARSNNGVVDVLKWWTLMATDVSSTLMFGECFHTLEHGEMNEYMQALAGALKGGGIGAEMPIVRDIGVRLPFKGPQELFNGNKTITQHGETAVKNMKTSGGGQNIFANIMAEAEKGERLEDRDVEIEASGLIVAGTDTTAITLTYLVYAVLSRPDLRQRVEEEVAGLSADYSDADLEDLPLLNAVIQETLRLYGAAPGMLPRSVPPGGVQMNGYFLPEGTTATTQSYSMHREPHLFPNPEEFIVARWVSSEADNDFKLSEAAKAAFSPFGAGSRTCLGIHLAMMELRHAAALWFRKCGGSKLAPSATPACMEQENYFLIAPAGHKCEVILKA